LDADRRTAAAATDRGLAPAAFRSRLIAGLEAGALSVIVWAASSFVEGLASMIVIWRFTGSDDV
jgi:hypothetical protein